jgi:hypothetical protein
MFLKRVTTYGPQSLLKSRLLDTTPITYRLRDMKDDEILSGFNEYKLQRVKNTGIYQIENISIIYHLLKIYLESIRLEIRLLLAGARDSCLFVC